MHNIETFHNKKRVVAETVGFRFEADFFNQYRWSYLFAVMDNIETFQNQITVAAESVGLRFEADFFKSVQIIIGFGWDASQ